MPLNLTVGDSDFTPFIKYNAKAGRWYVRAEGQDIEIESPTLAIDMAHIRTGWLLYIEGAGPSKIFDPSPSQIAARPREGKYKRGFEVLVYSNSNIPGTKEKIGLREFSSTASNAISAVLRMYNEFEKESANHKNSVPVFRCNGVKAINGNFGTNYEPQFSLTGWIERSRVPDFDKHVNDKGAESENPAADIDDQIPF